MVVDPDLELIGRHLPVILTVIGDPVDLNKLPLDDGFVLLFLGLFLFRFPIGFLGFGGCRLHILPDTPGIGPDATGTGAAFRLVNNTLASGGSGPGTCCRLCPSEGLIGPYSLGSLTDLEAHDLASFFFLHLSN